VPLRSVALAFVALSSAAAQTLIDPVNESEARAAFEQPTGNPLRCKIESIQPTLNYSFQFQTGYSLTFPLKQFLGTGDQLKIWVRVTPENHEPRYLASVDKIPAVAATNLEGQVSGRFLVGEGAYAVHISVQDDNRRSCRASWRIQAKLNGSERELKGLAPPGTISEIGAVAPLASQASHIGKLTILLHANSSYQNAPKLRDRQVDQLLETLQSILLHLCARSVRLVVFNLQQGKLLLENDSFTIQQMDQVKSALHKLDLSVIDYRSLQNKDRPVNLLDLLTTEAKSANPPDGIVLIGQRWPAYTAIGPPELPPLPPTFYLQFQAPIFAPRGFAGASNLPRRGGIHADTTAAEDLPDFAFPPSTPNSHDGLGVFLARMKGETLLVENPHELAGALRHIAARIPTTSRLAGVLPPMPAPIPQILPEAAAEEVPADPVEALIRLRDRIVKYGHQIPNHTCVETVDRARYEPVTGPAPLACETIRTRHTELRLDSTDRLRLDVKLTSTREIYSWAGAEKFDDREIDELIPEGAMGTGPYASMLLGLFGAPDLRFTFEGQSGSLLEYSFHVSRAQSSYRIKARGLWMPTGYSGLLFIDANTGELAGLHLRSDELSADTELCETQATLTFGKTPLGGIDYLLPASAMLRFIGRDGTADENHVEFASCREYRGEATLHFGDAPQTHADPSPSLVLPPGLPVSVELETPIRKEEVAAGDRITGRLAASIRDAAQNVLIPAGALVEGRIMRAEIRYPESVRFTVALRWESIEVNGAQIPVFWVPKRQGVQVAIPGPVRRRGAPIELPRPGEENYGVYAARPLHPVLEKGLQTEWLTH